MGLLQLHAVMRLFLKLSCELLGMNLSNGCSTSCEAGASFFRFSFITSFELHKSGLDFGLFAFAELCSPRSFCSHYWTVHHLWRLLTWRRFHCLEEDSYGLISTLELKFDDDISKKRWMVSTLICSSRNRISVSSRLKWLFHILRNTNEKQSLERIMEIT